MLTDYNAPNTVRVLSIDPGTRKMGVAIWEVDLLHNTHSIIFATSIYTEGMLKDYCATEKYFGEKAARLQAIEDELLYFMITFNVHEIASEAPYFRRMVTAFRALVECIGAITSATMQYNPYITLHLFDPASVKNAVGVNGNSGDKELMRAAIKTQCGHLFINGVDVDELDEHAIDAIAVGVACLIKLQLW